jgi:hypothetical protein
LITSTVGQYGPDTIILTLKEFILCGRRKMRQILRYPVTI